MNTAVKSRLFQFARTLQCRYFRHGRIEGLLKVRSDRDVFVVQRGKSTGADITRIHNLMRGREPRGAETSKKNEIGPIGYLLLSIPVSTFILGTWQIWRRQQKLAMIDDLHKRTESSPVELPEDLSELESMEYHPVKVRGKFLYDREFIIGPRSLIIKGAGASEAAGGVLSPGRSNSGYYVITPFKLEGRDLTILVNRGWVSPQYKKNPKPAHTQSNDVVEVTGLVRLNEKRPVFVLKNAPETGHWFYRDVESMSQRAGTAPVYIDLVSKEKIRGGPIAGQTRIALRNEHFSYIFTWYTLSVITAWMWHKKFIRKTPVF